MEGRMRIWPNRFPYHRREQEEETERQTETRTTRRHRLQYNLLCLSFLSLTRKFPSSFLPSPVTSFLELWTISSYSSPFCLFISWASHVSIWFLSSFSSFSLMKQYVYLISWSSHSLSSTSPSHSLLIIHCSPDSFSSNLIPYILSTVHYFHVRVVWFSGCWRKWGRDGSRW